MNQAPQIVLKNKNFIVINKPIGMPSQSDTTGDRDAMTVLSEFLTSLEEPSALWLIHRLDRNVGGLLVFARNKKSAAELSEKIQYGAFVKKYFAVCHGKPSEGEYTDYLYKDSSTSKSYVVKTKRMGAKEACLDLSLVASNGEMSAVSVTLHTGRFHQIRAQLSSRGNSLVGDKKYGSKDALCRTPALFAYSLSFEIFGEKISVSALPDMNEYPWNIFSQEIQNAIEE